MSYGYQGPPIPGENPPTYFEANPGAPSAPHSGGPSYLLNQGYCFSNAPPVLFEMPQPHTSYPSNPYQSQPMPYTPYLYSGGGPSEYPSQNQNPSLHLMESQNPSLYPTDYSAPYPQLYQYPLVINQFSPCPECEQSVSPNNYPPEMSHQHTPYPSADTSHNTPPSNSMHPSPHPQNANNPSASSCFSSAYAGGQAKEEGINPSIPGSMSAMRSNTTAAPPKNESYPKLSPTAVPYPGFDARADAEILRKAMKGFGTDEKAIINVLANRSNLQRQEIAVQFKTLYGKDLIKDLKSELSGNFEKLIVAMMTPLPQYYAKELHEAMSGIGTDECVLIEVMCTMSNHEIHVIRQAYEAMYGKSLEDDLRADTSGSFQRLMTSLCCGNRDESYDVDMAAAMEDAKRLLQAGELTFGTDESTFNSILVSRNIPQLHQIFIQYENITGHSIEEAIEKEFSGDIKKGLLAIVKCVKNRAKFFAEQLYKSMKGLGTDDRRLIRLVVTRSEIDMGEIMEVFAQQYGTSLEEFISGDCSGYYKKCLLALIA